MKRLAEDKGDGNFVTFQPDERLAEAEPNGTLISLVNIHHP